MNLSEMKLGTRNATIILILVGVLLIYTGYQFHQIAIIMHNPLQSTYGTFLIVFGALSFCTSLSVLFRKSWAPGMIVGVGVAVCVTQLVFGYYLIIVVFAVIYYIAWKQLNQTTEIPDWAPDWNED
ncbi:MAG: hypothetical protein ACFFEV_01005 [Candidatus Thorarchaeota archaeon]